MTNGKSVATARIVARKLGLTKEKLIALCERGCVRGAVCTNGVWSMPTRPTIHFGARAGHGNITR